MRSISHKKVVNGSSIYRSSLNMSGRGLWNLKSSATRRHMSETTARGCLFELAYTSYVFFYKISKKIYDFHTPLFVWYIIIDSSLACLCRTHNCYFYAVLWMSFPKSTVPGKKMMLLFLYLFSIIIFICTPGFSTTDLWWFSHEEDFCPYDSPSSLPFSAQLNRLVFDWEVTFSLVNGKHCTRKYVN